VNDYAGYGPETLEYLRRLHEYEPLPDAGRGGVTSTTTITGGITVVVPPGADGRAIASELVRGLEDRGIAVQANTGLR
jgi:hypothetical protein